MRDPTMRSKTAWMPRRFVRSGRHPARRSRLSAHVTQQPANGALEIATVRDDIEHAMIQEKFGSLEAFRKVLPDRLLDHTRTRKADHRSGLGDDRISEH